METEDENAVQPTRSLFGGTSNPFSGNADAGGLEADAELDVAEQSLEASQPADVQPEPVEPVVQEAVTEEPEPVLETTEEAQSDVEVAVEVPDEGTEVLEPVAEDPAPEIEEKPLNEIERLKAAREELDAQIADKQIAERKSIISQIAAVIKLYDIPLVDLMKALGGVPNPRKGEKAPILFKDDQGNTWTGRGKTPKWLRDKNIEDYRV